jgi:RNA recognition motif-containing protein
VQEKTVNGASAELKKLDIDFTKRRLYVTGLKPGTQEEELAAVLSKFGEVEDVSLLKNNVYAFVTFKYFIEIPPTFFSFNGTRIKISQMNPYNDPNVKTKILIANGKFTNLKADDLKKCFSIYGYVESVQIIQRNNVPRLAVIKFGTSEAVEIAVKTPVHLIQGQIVDIRKAR